MEYAYLVSPGVQIHHEVLGLRVSVAHLALVAVGVPGHALGHVPVLIMIMIIVIMIVMMILMMIVVMIVMMILTIVPVVLVFSDELVALVTLWARPGLKRLPQHHWRLARPGMS